MIRASVWVAKVLGSRSGLLGLDDNPSEIGRPLYRELI